MAKMKPKKAPPVMREYVVQGAPHTEGGVTYEPGETITTDRDMMSAFPGKFAPVMVAVAAPPRKPAPPPETDEDEETAMAAPAEDETDGEETEESALAGDGGQGEDVSGDFLTAAVKSVTVYEKAGVYSVCDAESGEELASGLTKGGVKKFLKDLHR